MSRTRGPAVLVVAFAAAATCGLVRNFAVPRASQRPAVATLAGGALATSAGLDQPPKPGTPRASAHGHAAVASASVAMQLAALAKPFAFCVLLGLLASPVRKMQGKLHDVLKKNVLLVDSLAELSATFMLIFFSFGAALSGVDAAVAFGSVVLVLATIFGPISGGHINPAVTFGLFAAGKVDGKKTASYICAQCVGALLGALALKYCLGLKVLGGFNMIAPSVHGGFSVGIWGAFAMEALGAALLVSTVLAGGTALPVAAAVVVAHLLLVPVTGCGINPARSLAPALVNGSKEALKHLWVFLAAPMLGGWLAGSKACWFAQGKK